MWRCFILFFFLNLSHSISIEIDSFQKTCNPSTFSMTAPSSILPHSLTSSRPTDSVIREWYEIGLKECHEYYDSHSKEWAAEKVGSPLYLTEVAGSRNNACRGNAMMYQTTGLLVWPFGPIEHCPTNSECWFGYLTCGEFQEGKLTQLFNSGTKPPVPLPKFQGWSMNGLDLDVRVIGYETIAPKISHLTLKSDGKLSEIDVLLAQYILTIPGDYHIEMRLQGLYPGMFYQWNQADLGKGVQMYNSLFLGGCEGRCPPYFNCGPFFSEKCDMSSFIGKSPYKMKGIHRTIDCSTDTTTNHKDNKEIKENKEKGSHSSIERHLSHSHHSHSSLPYCTHGNHTGRWIRLPDSIWTACGADKFEKLLKAEHVRQTGKRQDFGKYASIVTDYAQSTQLLDQEKIWESVKRSSTIETEKTEEDHYHQILSQYIGGNICVLTDLENPGKLEIFAPYDCKYRLFTSSEAINCLQKKDRKMLTFHGDSMSRNLYAAFSDIMGISGITPEQLKEIMNGGHKNNFTQSGKGVTISEIYTWDLPDKSIETIVPPLYPSVYVTNAALAHSIHIDTTTYTTTLTNSPLIQFWRQYHTSLSSETTSGTGTSSVRRIYQSSSAMHGKRNSGSKWMNEVFRRQNEINRKVFIDELEFLDFDEWIITAAKPDYGDGWHYTSVPLRMNAMILLNLMCEISS